MIADSMEMINAHVDADGWMWFEDYALWAGPNDLLNK